MGYVNNKHITLIYFKLEQIHTFGNETDFVTN